MTSNNRQIIMTIVSSTSSIIWKLRLELVLSCSIHAIGQMPLKIDLVSAEGEIVNQVYRN